MTVTDTRPSSRPPARPRDALAPRNTLGNTGKKINLQDLLRRAVSPGDDERHQDSVRDILHGMEELNRVREQCHTADEYYDGSVGMLYASERVRQLLARQGVGEDIKDFNYASIVVDSIAEKLKITSVAAAPAEEDGLTEEEDDAATESQSVKTATKAIAKLRKDNELDAEEKRLHKDVSKHGTAYVLVWPGTDRKGKPSVDIRVNSAHNVIMIYDEEDPLTADYALKSWEVDVGPDANGAPQTSTRANLYYADRIERWATEPGADPCKNEAWFRVTEVPDLDDDELDDLAADEFDTLDDEPGVQHKGDRDAYWGSRGQRKDFDSDDTDDDGYGDDDDDEDAQDERPAARLHPDDIPNPWGRIPWFHFRNDRPEGRPEHANAYGPQGMINKLIFAMAGTIDFNSFPQKYIMVDPTQDDPLMNMLDPDHPDDEDDPENTGGHSGLRNDPGEIWRLFGKSVGQFSAADPKTLLDPLDRLIKSMGELTSVPQVFSKMGADMPSGEAVRELNAGYNNKVQDRRDRYDPTWQDIYEMALEMLGIDGVTVEVRWAPLEIINDLAGWQVVQTKIEAGVPPQVALEEAGYAPETVKEWLADATGADLGRRVALMNQIGTAVQTLGAGIQLGATSAEQVQELVSRMLGLVVAGTDIEIPQGEFLDPIEKQRLNAETQMAIAGMKTGQEALAAGKQQKPGAVAGRAPGQAADRGKPPGAPGSTGAPAAKSTNPVRTLATAVPTTKRAAPPKTPGR